eukprot:15001435-Alexandrium_andersonii.AAC.1
MVFSVWQCILLAATIGLAVARVGAGPAAQEAEEAEEGSEGSDRHASRVAGVREAPLSGPSCCSEDA